MTPGALGLSAVNASLLNAAREYLSIPRFYGTVVRTRIEDRSFRRLSEQGPTKVQSDVPSCDWWPKSTNIGKTLPPDGCESPSVRTALPLLGLKK